MAKTFEDLGKSRDLRAEVKAKYGFIPYSVLTPNYTWGKHIIELDARKQPNVATEKHKQMKYNLKEYVTQGGETKQFNQQIDAFWTSGQNVRGKGAGLSTFPPELARFIVEFYSEKNDLIGDCFAGHNSRMQITYELGRSYTGYDVCASFMAFNHAVVKEITGEGAQPHLFKSNNTITLREQTSEQMVEPDNFFDMIYTSPPYGIEYYDDHPKQIGYREDYGVMLQRLMVVLSECFRTLKPNKFCIWNINDYRKESNFYPFHADIVKAYQKVGFTLHDILIVKWPHSIMGAFASQIEERKIPAKIHEYLVVGKKKI